MFTADFKAGFFDRKAVLDAVDKARLRVLKEYGRRVRKRAQASLQYSDKTSAPGQPPFAHKTRRVTRKSRSTGRIRQRSVSYLREFLYFAYDPSSKSVVVGPARLSNVADPEAPHILEYGGTVQGNNRTITITNAVGRNAKGQFASGGKRKVVLAGSVTHAARPFMHPAEAAERPGLEGLWKNSVR